MDAFFLALEQQLVGDRSYDPSVAMPDEPRIFNDADQFDALLRHAFYKGASDITAQTEEPVMAVIHGRNMRMTRRSLSSGELEFIAQKIYGDNAVSQLRAGKDIDHRHPVVCRGLDANGQQTVKERLGFRVNITSCWAKGSEEGIQITARSIRSIPPTLKEIGAEPEIVAAMHPENGIIFVGGPTGSGKSTLLAAVIRSKLEDPSLNLKILTYEYPIEYVYDEVEKATSLISQHEISRHLTDFSAGVRNSLRRAPTDILVGESRDRETISAAIEAAETGHRVFTTIHINSVQSMVSRVANMFAPAERLTKLFEVVETTRLVVVQRLVPKRGGGRVALREFLVFDQYVRDQVRQLDDPHRLEGLLQSLVAKRGQSFLGAAHAALEKGLIDREVAARMEKEASLMNSGIDFTVDVP